jgi:hypothetical protein
MAFDYTLTSSGFVNELVSSVIGAPNERSNGSIGAVIRAEYEFELSGTFDDASPAVVQGTTWVFNPALFLPPGIPNVVPPGALPGYRVTIPPGALNGQVFTATLWNGTWYQETHRNLEVTAEVISSTKLLIRHRFILTADQNDYITSAIADNYSRLMKSVVNAPDLTVAVADSVYRSQNRVIGLRVAVIEPSQTRVSRTFSLKYWSRFYLYGNDGSLNPPLAELVGPGFGYEMELWRGGQLVDDLCALAPTEVRVYLSDVPAYELKDVFRVYVLDMTVNPWNELGTFLTQYGTQGVDVDANTVVDGQVLGGRVVGIATPIEAITYDRTPAHRIRFRVDGDLDPSRIYSIAVVVGAQPVGQPSQAFTNSFIRPNLRADGAPPAPVFAVEDLRSDISDYNTKTLSNSVETCVSDFLRLKVGVRAEAYNEQAFGGSTWSNDMLSARLRIIDADTGAVLVNLPWSKQGGQWTGANTVEEFVDGEWVDYSVTVPMVAPNGGGVPTFSGMTLQAVWSFTLNTVVGQLEYQYRQNIVVDPYGNFTKVIQSIRLLDFETGLPITSLCETSLVLVEVRLNPALSYGRRWNIRAQLTLPPHVASPLLPRPSGTQIEQSYEGELPQLGALPIQSLPAVFNSSGVATFIVHPDHIPSGVMARLHVIAQPTCQGAGRFSFHNAGGQAFYAQVETPTRYWACVSPAGVKTVNEYDFSTDGGPDAEGVWCCFVCDEEGNPVDVPNVQYLEVEGPGIDRFHGGGMKPLILDLNNSALTEPPDIRHMDTAMQIGLEINQLSVGPSLVNCKALTYFNISFNQLPTPEVDRLLVELDGIGTTNGQAIFIGPLMGTPSAVGIAARNNLIAKGWLV